jgi:hypothetical protein
MLSGLLAFGVPEVGMLLAAGILGKEGFARLKEQLAKLLRRYGPPQAVGATRYRVGLVLFTVPLLYALIAPYLPQFFHGPDIQRFEFALAGDLLLLVSLLVLGGEFWDKLRALFVHRARAVMPAALGPPSDPVPTSMKDSSR